jgi:hypothetical protein
MSLFPTKSVILPSMSHILARSEGSTSTSNRCAESTKKYKMSFI